MKSTVHAKTSGWLAESCDVDPRHLRETSSHRYQDNSLACWWIHSTFCHFTVFLLLLPKKLCMVRQGCLPTLPLPHLSCGFMYCPTARRSSWFMTKTPRSCQYMNSVGLSIYKLKFQCDFFSSTAQSCSIEKSWKLIKSQNLLFPKRESQGWP